MLFLQVDKDKAFLSSDCQLFLLDLPSIKIQQTWLFESCIISTKLSRNFLVVCCQNSLKLIELAHCCLHEVSVEVSNFQSMECVEFEDFLHICSVSSSILNYIAFDKNCKSFKHQSHQIKVTSAICCSSEEGFRIICSSDDEDVFLKELLYSITKNTLILQSVIENAVLSPINQILYSSNCLLMRSLNVISFWEIERFL